MVIGIARSLTLTPNGENGCGDLMKLVVQIPCLNEAETIGETLRGIPDRIDGVDEIETIIVDDGSGDGTAAIALACGATRVVRLNRNRGLAAAFRAGLDASIEAGADVIVNMDGDNQYPGAAIPDLVAPVVAGRADIAIGDRAPSRDPRNPPLKRLLYRAGRAAMNRLCGTRAPDPVSGFRALSRDAAVEINIFSCYSYTLEMIIQAEHKRLGIAHIPIRTNTVRRPSRLFGSIPQFMYYSGRTMLETYFLYRPLKLFAILGTLALLAGVAPIVRFLLHFARDGGAGHVQSLVLGSGLVLTGMLLYVAGLLGHLAARNRVLLENVSKQLKMTKCTPAVAPWHFGSSGRDHMRSAPVVRLATSSSA